MGCRVPPARWPVEIVVARIIARVEQTRLSLRAVMEDFFARYPELRPIRGLARAYALGVLKRYMLLDYLAAEYVGVEPQLLPPLERNLLRALVYEAKFRDVELRRILRVARALRAARLTRQCIVRLKAVPVEEAVRSLRGYERLAVLYSVPRWVVELLVSTVGKRDALRMLKRFNKPATVWLRVNTLRTSRDRLARALERRGVRVEEDPDLPDALRVVESRVNVSHLPEYRAGLFYIQDKASMLVAHALSPGEGGEVFDACAAPGGKAGHAYQLGRGLVVAAELKRGRARSMVKELRRLGLDGVQVIVADSRLPPLRKGFRWAILDADCSSLGRLGHSPEIRLWIRPEYVSRYAEEQRRLLRAVSRVLARDGVLVYSTCTVTVEENEENTAWACDELGFRLEGFEPNVGVPGLRGLAEARRLYPHLHDTQGFYLARLVKE